MPWMEWYDSLAKPGWTLAPATIGLIWQILYPIILVIWPYYRWIAVAQVPYFVWVSLATVLQLSITWMNWGR
jgi:translocator protein